MKKIVFPILIFLSIDLSAQNDPRVKYQIDGMENVESPETQQIIEHTLDFWISNLKQKD